MDESTHEVGLQKASHWEGYLEIGYLGSNRNPEQQVCTFTLLLLQTLYEHGIDIYLCLDNAGSVGSRDVGLRNLESQDHGS